jgi:hypothetical protein
VLKCLQVKQCGDGDLFQNSLVVGRGYDGMGMVTS